MPGGGEGEGVADGQVSSCFGLCMDGDASVQVSGTGVGLTPSRP